MAMNDAGMVDSKAAGGGTVINAYPLDRSSFKVEGGRGKDLAGGPTDLSHSLAGASTNNNGSAGTAARGRKSTISEPSKVSY